MAQTTILVPLDGSVIAEAGLGSACRLARNTGATLWLMRAVAFSPPELDAEGVERLHIREAKAYLHAVQENLTRQGFTAHIEVLPSEPVRAILFACEAHDIDVISISTHGRGGLLHALVGSVAEAVFKWQPTPILLTRAGRQTAEQIHTPFSRLVVPLDGSAQAETALTFLGKEHLGRGGEVILFRAVTPTQFPSVPMMTGAAATEMLEQVESDIVKHQAEADAYLAAAGNIYLSGLHWKPRSAVGYAGQEIPAAATAEHADLIVMATHARHGFDKLIHGSVAEEVVRHADMPVLLVRGTDRPEERGATPHHGGGPPAP